jgi:hypothetical protein
MSLSNQVLDFADDTTKELLTEIVREAPLPQMVKRAQVTTRETKEGLPRSSFALVAFTKEGAELRKFPIHDEASAWLSCRYFEKTAHKLPAKAREVAGGMLKKACAIYGLKETPTLTKIAKARGGNSYYENQDMTKTAAPIQVEALEHSDSEHFYALNNRYAMPSPEFVKKAAAYFVDFEKSFADAEDRHTFAKNVLARAQELDVELEHAKTLRKYASEGYGDILEAQVRMRLDLLQARPEMSAALEKVAAYKRELEAPEFAKLLHTFDKKASLDKYYGGYLADAYKSTFERRLTKEASSYSYDSEDAGEISDKELTKAFEDKYDKVKGYFGPTVADQLKKHGCVIFDSLPKDAKETLVKITKGQI